VNADYNRRQMFSGQVLGLLEAGVGVRRLVEKASHGDGRCDRAPPRGEPPSGGRLEDEAVHYDEIMGRVVAVVGKAGARELLDALTRSEADRSALIGPLFQRADAEWLAELLIDLEEDEPTRLHLIEALRHNPKTHRVHAGGQLLI
jgi:hypothetical protein